MTGTDSLKTARAVLFDHTLCERTDCGHKWSGYRPHCHGCDDWIVPDLGCDEWCVARDFLALHAATHRVGRIAYVIVDNMTNDIDIQAEANGMADALVADFDTAVLRAALPAAPAVCGKPAAHLVLIGDEGPPVPRCDEHARVAWHRVMSGDVAGTCTAAPAEEGR